MIRYSGSLELAHARLCARRGLLPGQDTWRRVEPVRELATMLDIAHASPLSRWISGIGASDSAHAIEATLRRHWREEVREVASWMPGEWQAAVRWFALWRDLPVLEHFARHGEMQPWMRQDPVYRLLSSSEMDSPAPSEQTPDIADLRSLCKGADVAQRWSAAWQARLPHPAKADSALQAWFRCVIVERQASRNTPAGAGGWPGPWHARLELLFRRAMLDPASAFIYLALLALDLDRLRGELVRRALFSGLALAA